MTQGQHVRIPWLWLMLLLTLLSPLQAATLAEAVNAALDRHPEKVLPAAQRKVEAGHRRQAETLLGGDPEIQVSAAGDDFGSDFGYEEYVAGVSVPVALPAQRSAHGLLADRMALAAESAAITLRWRVAGEVIDRAWRLRIARTDLKEATRQWAAARALVKDIQHRFDVGEVSRNDLLMARQDLVSVESSYQEALDALQKARLAWHNHTGLDAVPEDLDTWSATMKSRPLKDHPALASARAEVEIARARVEAARAQRRAPPVISLFAKRDRGSRHEEYTDALGVSLSVPLGTQTPAAAAIAEAEAELTRAQARLAAARRDLVQRQREAEQTLSRALHLHRLAQENHRLSRSRLKLAQRAFELGEMDLYQLLLARRQSHQATRELRLRELEKGRAQAMVYHLSGETPR